jgi:hypothetical protein
MRTVVAVRGGRSLSASAEPAPGRRRPWPRRARVRANFERPGPRAGWQAARLGVAGASGATGGSMARTALAPAPSLAPPRTRARRARCWPVLKLPRSQASTRRGRHQGPRLRPRATGYLGQWQWNTHAPTRNRVAAGCVPSGPASLEYRLLAATPNSTPLDDGLGGPP